MKKKIGKRIMQFIFPAAGLWSFIFLPPWLLVKAWILPLPDSIEMQLVESMNHGMDGAIVYINMPNKTDEKTRIEASFAAGWKNREEQLPAKPQHYFKIASIAKLYQAVSAVKMHHAGLLDIDRPLSTFRPDLVGQIQHAERITLRMMLQHRSGIPNFTDNPDFPWAEPPRSADEALSYAYGQSALFDPGTDYSYSNTNYVLLGQIMDAQLGYPHFEFIEREILAPLGLTHTFASMHDVPADSLMSGYAVDYDLDIKGNDFGSMVATAEDVGQFIRALNTGNLLSSEERETYLQVYKLDHTGLLPGYQSIAEYNAELDAVVVMFNNTSGGLMWNLLEISHSRIEKLVKKHGDAVFSAEI